MGSILKVMITVNSTEEIDIAWCQEKILDTMLCFIV